jgi:SNF2 family DNA or RNA helicase
MDLAPDPIQNRIIALHRSIQSFIYPASYIRHLL